MQRKAPPRQQSGLTTHTAKARAAVLDPARTPGPFVHRPPFWRARELLRMRRVDQGHARNLVGVPGGRHLHVQAGEACTVFAATGRLARVKRRVTPAVRKAQLCAANHLLTRGQTGT
jgi:hypothetical protein